MQAAGQPLSELKKCLKKYPQAQRNLVVREKRPLEELPQITNLVRETENELNGKGRVLLRYSGTEPKVRLLIEGREQSQIDRQADRIADAIQSAIGA
jgi:phosphoglucosamine mutase